MGVLLKRRVMHTVLYVISIVIALITGFPFLFLVINSFKGMGEYLTNIWMLPKEPYLGNYQMILKPDFLRYFLNSVIVSAISVFIIVVVSSCLLYTSYALQGVIQKMRINLVLKCQKLSLFFENFILVVSGPVNHGCLCMFFQELLQFFFCEKFHVSSRLILLINCISCGNPLG